MDDRAGVRAAAISGSGARLWVVFALGHEQFALPMASVEAVAPPPPLARVPHAAPAVLGVGHLGGRIVPILDFAAVLGREPTAERYGGSGEVIRLRIPGGSAAIWVDRVERLIEIDPEPRRGSGGSGDISLIDPSQLLIAALASPDVASGPPTPVGQVADRVLPDAVGAIAVPFILVEAAGKRVQLRREAVVELIDAVPWTPVPRAPAGFLGVGVLRGVALPILSLAALLGLAAPASPGGFAVTELAGRRALLAVDRIIGLRFDRDAAGSVASEPSAEGEVIEIAAAVPKELCRIVAAFPQNEDDARPDDGAKAGDAVEYLAFSVGAQDFAVPIACIDRVVAGQRLIRLPRPANDDSRQPRIAGAIELHGQIVPVAALRSRLGFTGDETPSEPSGYLVLRGVDGLGAIGIDRIKRVAMLRPGEIAAPPVEHELIEGVTPAGPADGGLLRIIAPTRLWGGGE